MADLQASIEDFGLVEDVVVNVNPARRGVVVGGHQRLKILQAKGVERIPCKEVDLGLDRERELNARLNANGGRFSAKLLVEGGFDRAELEAWGFSYADLLAFDKATEAFGPPEPEADWKAAWAGMPEFEHEDQEPWQSVKVHFAKPEDRQAFAALVEQPLTDQTRSIWFPPAEIGRIADKRFRTDDATAPRYPVYVISKGRWETRLTAKALEKIGIPYRIVVEPQEFDQYAAMIDPAKILTLPFSNLGQGSIPARNWVWEHSVSEGAERHWILDDNIKAFYRFQGNLKTPVVTAATFRAAEDFTDRWENVAISGMNYFMFVSRKSGDILPYTLNTRIYSCILLRNDVPYRWRGRYNEDTDLSLRALKDGWCTILFNAFLAEKMTTMAMKGGNTDQLYQGDGRLQMAQSLHEQHPDVVTITQKWGRWQHQVDYRPFKRNRLIPRPGVVLPEGPDNYGMWLEVDGAGEEPDAGPDDLPEDSSENP